MQTDRIVEARLGAMEGMLSACLEMMKELTEADSMRLMSVSDIAKMYGISRSKLYDNIYLLPNFGEGTEEPKTYLKGEVREWLRIHDNNITNIKKAYIEHCKAKLQ